MARTENRFRYIAITILISCYLFIAKGPLEYFLHLDNRTVTMIIYMILLISLFAYSFSGFRKNSTLYYLYILYIFVRCIMEIAVNRTGFIQPFSAFVKYYIFATLLELLINNFTELPIEYRKAVLVFFLFTAIISFIQFTRFPFSKIFTEYGGNIISGNALGLIRSNGGIGGTAIDYSVLLILILFVYVNSKDELSIQFRYVFLLAYILSVFMNFSRAVILCIAVILFFQIMKRTERKIILRWAFIILACLSSAFFILRHSYSSINVEKVFVLFSYDPSRVRSDTLRTTQWKEGLEIMKKLQNILLGESYGRNTGLPVDQPKLIGDGFWISYFLDTGLVGFFLFLAYITDKFKFIFQQINKKRRIIFLAFILCFLLFNIISSGFDMHINIILFPIVLVSHRHSIQKNKDLCNVMV